MPASQTDKSAETTKTASSLSAVAGDQGAENADLVARLRSSEPLPVCPYDKRSPDYWTAPNDKPCVVCGTLNDPDAPDLCRGADTRIMGEAADKIEWLRSERSEMLAALKDMFALIDEGWLVRDTSGDGNPSWAMKQLRFVQRLQKAQAAITKAEGRS